LTIPKYRFQDGYSALANQNTLSTKPNAACATFVNYFLDTGMGEDGYSSMEQGKVEWILQAKPEERRELFEEAAGISKYRARREEAMRKLDRVEIDLSRISDIVSVTNDQIRKLENAVNRAKIYERIRGELKTMEISDWLFQLGNIHAESELKQKDLTQTDQQSQALKTQIHQSEADLAELRRQMTETEEHLLEANGVLSAIDADIKIGEERVSHAHQREKELEQQLQSLQEAIQSEENRKTELHAQEVEKQTELDNFRTSGQNIEAAYQESKSKCDAALQNLEKKGQEIKEVRDLVLERTTARAQIQQEISQLTSDVSRIKSQIENIEKESLRFEEELLKTNSLHETQKIQKDSLTEQASLKNSELGSLTQKISDLKDREKDLQDKILKESEQIAQLKGQIHSIEQQQSKDPYAVGTKTLLEAGLSGKAILLNLLGLMERICF